MGVNEDLEQARAEFREYVSVEAAVAAIASLSSVTQQEAAQWLLNKRVESRVTQYVRLPASLRTTSFSTFEDGAKRVEKYLRGVVQGYGFLEDVFDLLGGRLYDGDLLAWEAAELNAFLVDNGLTPLPAGLLAPADDLVASSTSIDAERSVAYSREAHRKEKLLDAIRERFPDPLVIPLGKKAQLRAELCAADPRLFTESTFDKAWRDLSSAGQIAIAGKVSFVGRPLGGSG